MDSPSKTTAAILFAALVIRALFIFVTPMVEAPDEFAHYWVTKFIVEHLRLPGSEEVASGGPSAVYGSMPALGYIPHALGALIFSFLPLSLSERFGSVIMGLITVNAAIKLGRELFGERKLLAHSLPLIVCFHPQLVFVNSYCNNDSTAIALGSVLLLLFVRAVRAPPDVKSCLIIGLLSGGIVMSKYSGAALVLAVFAGLFLSFRIQRRTWAETFKVSTIVLCAAAVVAAPFLLRNAVEFNSDFLGTGTMQKTWAEAYGRTEVPTLSPAQLLKQRLWWYQMFTSFFGVFGYQSRYLAAPFYALYFLFVLLSVSGPAASFVFKGDGNGGKAQEPMRLVWFTLILAVVFNFASLVAASCLNVGGPQGRYLLPSELAIVALMLAGLDRLPERISRAAVVSLTLFNAAASVSSLIVLYRLFGFVGRPY